MKTNMIYDFASARFKASQLMPYLSRHLMSLVPIEKPGVGTMAVDEHGRVYYDPERFKEWSIQESAWVILHEDMHVVFDHAKRCKAHLGQKPGGFHLYLWNLATDAAINETLREAWQHDKGSASVGQLPEGCVYPETFGFPRNKSAEEYYDLLIEKFPPPPEQEGGGESGEGEGEGDGQAQAKAHAQGMPGGGQSWENGSSSDGQPKPWEDGPPGETGADGQPTPDGLDEFERERLKRVVAQEVERYQEANGRGNMPAGLARFAKQIMKPKIDPKRELMAACRFAISCVSGFGTTTFAKLNRRQPSGSMRLPAHQRPIPRVCIIGDTSGSMNEKDLALVLGLVEEVTRALPTREGITVVTGDTQMATCQRVFGADRVEMAGGGGTDMGAILQEVATHKPPYNVIMVATDGETGWCDQINARVIACLTRKTRYSNAPPDWIQTIYLHDEED